MLNIAILINNSDSVKTLTQCYDLLFYFFLCVV